MYLHYMIPPSTSHEINTTKEFISLQNGIFETPFPCSVGSSTDSQVVQYTADSAGERRLNF